MEEAGYLSMMVSMMDYGSPVKEGELYSILCGDLVAVGFDFETGENRDLSADEMSRVADYFTEVSKFCDTPELFVQAGFRPLPML